MPWQVTLVAGAKTLVNGGSEPGPSNGSLVHTCLFNGTISGGSGPLRRIDGIIIILYSYDDTHISDHVRVSRLG